MGYSTTALVVTSAAALAAGYLLGSRAAAQSPGSVSPRPADAAAVGDARGRAADDAPEQHASEAKPVIPYIHWDPDVERRGLGNSLLKLNHVAVSNQHTPPHIPPRPPYDPSLPPSCFPTRLTRSRPDPPPDHRLRRRPLRVILRGHPRLPADPPPEL